MEDKALFSRLMDMGAAHYSSYEELVSFYDVVRDIKDNIIIYDKKVYSSKEVEEAEKDIYFFAKQFRQEYAEFFAMSVGKELKKDGLPDMNDPDELLHPETIIIILEKYGLFLRENRKASDDSYKDNIWNMLHKDPKALMEVR